MIVSDIRFASCHSDYSVFIRHIKSGIVILTVYVDDILLTGSDCEFSRNKRVSQASFCDEGYGEAKIFP